MRDSMARRGARHRDAPQSAPLRRLLGTAFAIAAATTVTAALSGGTYAFWSDSAAVAAGTVQSGSIGLTTASSFSPASWSNLVVGESARQPFTVTNTGTVPVALSATATAGSSFAIRVAAGTCPTSDLTGTPATTSATALGALAAGATRTLCLQVTAAAGATSNTSSAFLVTVSGVQS